MRDYRRMVDDVLDPLFGHLPLRAVSAELVDSYRAHLVAEGRLAPRTINKYLLVLHAIFKRAQRHFGLTSNPVAGLDRQPVRPSGDFRVLTPEEVEALARAARAGAHRTPPPAPAAVGADSGRPARGTPRTARSSSSPPTAGCVWASCARCAGATSTFAKRLIHVRRAYSLGEETCRCPARSAPCR